MTKIDTDFAPMTGLLTTPLSFDLVHRKLGMGKYDPVLAEVWEIKAKINKAANYDVMQIPTVLNLTVHPT